MKCFLQLVILSLLIANMLAEIYWSCNGRPQRDPTGFGGVIAVLLLAIGAFALYYFAGTFSELFAK